MCNRLQSVCALRLRLGSGGGLEDHQALGPALPRAQRLDYGGAPPVSMAYDRIEQAVAQGHATHAVDNQHVLAIEYKVVAVQG